MGGGSLRVDRGARRAVTAVLLLVAAATAGVVTGGAVPAAADGPTVVVSPDHVVDGQTVGIDISGFPAAPSSAVNVVVQCAAAVVAAPQQAPSLCSPRSILSFGGTPPPHVDWTVAATFVSYDGSHSVDCVADPEGCVAGFVQVDNPFGAMTVTASAFDEIFLVNIFSGTPTRRLSDGDAVTVTGRNVAPGDWSIVQCDRAFLLDPTPAQAAALCATPQPVTPDVGAFTAELVVHEPLVPAGAGAEPVTCGATDCVVVLLSASSTGDPVGASFGISFGPPTLTAVPDHDLIEGQLVTVTVDGAPAGDVLLYECDLPVPPTASQANCLLIIGGAVGDTGSASVTFNVVAQLEVSGGPVIDCRATDCVFAVYDGDHQLVAQTTPLTFAPAPTLTLEPSTGLLEGTDMTLTADHLLPSAPYIVQRCKGDLCDDGQQPTTTAGGTLTATVPASQLLRSGSQFGYCRADCEVVVRSLNPSPALRAPYTMADGAVAASPSTGLGDGQTIHVTGTDLMPTYAGPTIWIFPTGGWALTQCDKAVLDSPSLFSALVNCAAAPVTRAVTVSGSTFDETLDVRATITRIVGGTTDCTAAPGACVVGLFRFEQDGSASAHFTPVTFAP
jgi:hypothetical protein